MSCIALTIAFIMHNSDLFVLLFERHFFKLTSFFRSMYISDTTSLWASIILSFSLILFCYPHVKYLVKEEKDARILTMTCRLGLTIGAIIFVLFFSLFLLVINALIIDGFRSWLFYFSIVSSCIWTSLVFWAVNNSLDMIDNTVPDSGFLSDNYILGMTKPFWLFSLCNLFLFLCIIIVDFCVTHECHRYDFFPLANVVLFLISPFCIMFGSGDSGGLKNGRMSKFPKIKFPPLIRKGVNPHRY